MKAIMNSQGVITISAENGAEAFALKWWSKEAEIKVDDVIRDLYVHLNPRMLVIDANEPNEVAE